MNKGIIIEGVDMSVSEIFVVLVKITIASIPIAIVIGLINYFVMVFFLAKIIMPPM